MMSRILKTGVMGFVIVMFILNFVPVIETGVVTTGITNTFVATMLDMMVWVLPIGMLVGVLYYAFKAYKNG